MNAIHIIKLIALIALAIIAVSSFLGKKSKSPVLLSFVRDFEVWLMNLSMSVRTVSISWQHESRALVDHSVYVHCKQ